MVFRLELAEISPTNNTEVPSAEKVTPADVLNGEICVDVCSGPQRPTIRWRQSRPRLTISERLTASSRGEKTPTKPLNHSAPEQEFVRDKIVFVRRRQLLLVRPQTLQLFSSMLREETTTAGNIFSEFRFTVIYERSDS
jgi:hypothetical protein